MNTKTRFALSALFLTAALLTATVAVALNPQPEPPAPFGKGKLILPSEKKGINPQPEPPKIIKGMTANQFQSLAPSAQLEIRGKQIAKSEVIKALDKSRAANVVKSQAAVQKSAAELQKRANDLKMKVTSGNSSVKAKFAAFHAGSVNVEKKPLAKNSLGIKPTITELYAQDNIVRPGGWLAVKGEYFGGNPGTVNLTGNFPGGRISLIIKEWYSDAIMAEVPIMEGAPDQLTTLEVLTPGNQKATVVQVPFLAERAYAQIPASQLIVADCSHNASFHNACKVDQASSYLNGEHQDLPDAAAATSGTDRYTIKPLKNGWKAISAGAGALSYNCNLSGNSISCPWSTKPETVTMDFGMLGTMTATITSNIYTIEVLAEGPKGVPMQ